MLTVVTKHANFLETFALKSRTLLLKRVVAGGWSLTLHNFQWQSSPKNPPQKIPSLTFLLNVSLLIKFQNLHVKKKFRKAFNTNKTANCCQF